MINNNLTQTMQDLVGFHVGLYTSDGTYVVGVLSDIKKDYITIRNKKGEPFYFMTERIQTLSKNTKEFQESIIIEESANEDHLMEVLNKHQYHWVTINCQSKVSFTGILSDISDDHIMLLVKNEKIIIQKPHITSFYPGLAQIVEEEEQDSSSDESASNSETKAEENTTTQETATKSVNDATNSAETNQAKNKNKNKNKENSKSSSKKVSYAKNVTSKSNKRTSTDLSAINDTSKSSKSTSKDSTTTNVSSKSSKSTSKESSFSARKQSKGTKSFTSLRSNTQNSRKNSENTRSNRTEITIQPRAKETSSVSNAKYEEKSSKSDDPNIRSQKLNETVKKILADNLKMLNSDIQPTKSKQAEKDQPNNKQAAKELSDNHEKTSNKEQNTVSWWGSFQPSQDKLFFGVQNRRRKNKK